MMTLFDPSVIHRTMIQVYIGLLYMQRTSMIKEVTVY